MQTSKKLGMMLFEFFHGEKGIENHAHFFCAKTVIYLFVTSNLLLSSPLDSECL
jgi:hypothetical protein